ncbi:hypothetical protein GCM10023091_36560 [Ravibacter arvi]|uniref:Uncharacterized protein n=1 Tax=Ravibacter arvi TaxID=2051041 RepID=A0ABP8M8D8_9BACT
MFPGRTELFLAGTFIFDLDESKNERPNKNKLIDRGVKHSSKVKRRGADFISIMKKDLGKQERTGSKRQSTLETEDNY